MSRYPLTDHGLANEMKKPNQRALAISVVALPLLAGALFLAVTDSIASSEADQLWSEYAGGDTTLMKKKQEYTDDSKWQAVKDRIVVSRVYIPKQIGTETLDRAVFPSTLLPGNLRLKEVTERAKEMEALQASDNIMDNHRAYTKAKDFCKITQEHTPEAVDKDVALRKALINVSPSPANLPLYSEYCGVDAMRYEALTTPR